MRPRKRVKAKKKNPSRLRTYSFTITIVVIAIFIVGSYFQSLPTVEHIPAGFEFKSQEWMPYVPSDAQYVGYVNYRQAYYASHNSSLLGTETLLEIPQLGLEIIPMDITYEVVIQLPEPKYSGSTTILQLTAKRQTDLVNDLASVNVTRTHLPFNYDGYMVYELLMRKFGDQNLNLGYMTVFNNHLMLSNDKSSGLQNVEAILDHVSSSEKSLFDDITVRQAVYATGVTDENYVGLYVGMFSTQLNDTKMVVKTVIGNGDSISVSRALLFSTSGIALEHLNEAHEIYKNAASYRILDSWLVVTYNYPLGKLRSELIGI